MLCSLAGEVNGGKVRVKEDKAMENKGREAIPNEKLGQVIG